MFNKNNKEEPLSIKIIIFYVYKGITLNATHSKQERSLAKF